MQLSFFAWFLFIFLTIFLLVWTWLDKRIGLFAGILLIPTGALVLWPSEDPRLFESPVVDKIQQIQPGYYKIYKIGEGGLVKISENRQGMIKTITVKNFTPYYELFLTDNITMGIDEWYLKVEWFQGSKIYAFHHIKGL